MKKELFTQLTDGTTETRLICFPYLGGYSHAFHEFAEKLDDSIDLWAANPPGHGNSPYPLFKDVDEVVDAYMGEIANLLTTSTIFLGYSMGGIVIYHLMKRILSTPALQNNIPKKMIIFACGSPDSFTDCDVSNDTDKQVIEKMLGYGALPEKIQKNKAIMKYLMPIFRADCHVLDSAKDKVIEPIDSEVAIVWGNNDPKIKLPMVTRWNAYFQNRICIRVLNGSYHMFIHDEPEECARIIEKIIFNK